MKAKKRKQKKRKPKLTGFEKIERQLRKMGWKETALGWKSPDGTQWRPK